MNQNWQPGDRVYIFPGEYRVFDYYRDTKVFKISADSVRRGNGRYSTDEYIQEILTLRGRQWIVDCPNEFAAKLTELGYSLKDEFHDVGTGLFLFDFK